MAFKTRTPLLALIDADTLVYEASTVNERAINWGDEPDGQDDLWTVHANLEPAKNSLDVKVANLKKKLGADRVIMALSDYTDPWRKRVMPDYKRNRSGTRKPLLIPELREHVQTTYTTVQRPGLEGDDVLGILLTASPFAKIGGKPLGAGARVLVSIDKDMQTLPGRHFNFRHDEFRDVTEDEADHYHMLQTLTGDRVDGYPGCPGVGPVKAQKLLEGRKGYAEMWPVVVDAYAKVKLGVEEALRNARVARICRADDYDFKAKQVRLWSPPK